MVFDLSRRHFLSAAAAASCAPSLIGAPQETPSGTDKGIVDLTRSPYAVMHAVPIGAVKMTAGFWAKRIQVNRATAIPFTYQQMEDHGRFDDYTRWDGKAQALRAGFQTTHPSGLR